VVDGDGDVQPEIGRLEHEIPSFKSHSYSSNQGKGFALREGVKNAKGDYIIYTDIDFPYTTESLFKIYSTLSESDCQLAIGIKDDNYYRHVPASRRLLSKAFRKMIGLFLSLPVTDTQCGLKGMKKEVKGIFLQTTINRYLFDLEFIRLAQQQQVRMQAVEIELNADVKFRGMNYKLLFPEVMNFLKILFTRR
jgi:glycosyltransferase involved in cell wall biosynthesis